MLPFVCVCVIVQVMGSLADKRCAQGQRVSGILVKRNFSYHILTPSDLSSESVRFPKILGMHSHSTSSSPISLAL